MGFRNEVFPLEIGGTKGPSLGSSGGPGFNTSVFTLASGAEERISRWANARRRYNPGMSIEKPEQMASVMEHYLAVGAGAAHSFPYKDPSDHSTTATHTSIWPNDASPAFDDVVIGTGDGTTTKFQLIKTYTVGSYSLNRTIELPIPGTVTSGVNGVEQTITTEWTVNTTTGEVDYVTPPANGLAVTAGFDLYDKVRYGEGIDLQMSVNLEGFDIGSIPDIPLVAVRSELPDPEYAWNGGSVDQGTIGANFSVTLSEGRVHKITPSANIQVTLPDETDLQDGSNLFVFYNESGSFTVELLYADTTSIVTIAVSTSRVVDLVDIGGGLKEWKTY